MARHLQSALISITDARRYLGGVSRSHFYAKIIPQLDELSPGCPATIKLGRRRMIKLRVLEALMRQLDRVWWFLLPTAVLHIHQWGFNTGHPPTIMLHHV